MYTSPLIHKGSNLVLLPREIVKKSSKHNDRQGRISQVFLVIIISLTILSSLNDAYGQTQTICANQPIPTGWVKVSQRDCGKCCGAYLQYTIQKIDQLPTGATVNMCAGQAVPAGWVIIGQYDCKCCGAYLQYTIQKITGMAIGSIIQICAGQSIPSGWVKSSEQTCTNKCCGPYIRYTITKIEGMAIGATTLMCAGNIVPDGWIIVGQRDCKCCGAYMQYTIRYIKGMAAGTTIQICAGQSIPAGWQKISTQECNGCCGPYVQWTIRSSQPSKIGYRIGVDVNNEASITIAPNPVHDMLKVSCRDTLSESKVYTVFDQSGRPLLQGKCQLGNDESFTIDVSLLPKGVYFLQVLGERFKEQVKFLIE